MAADSATKRKVLGDLPNTHTRFHSINCRLLVLYVEFSDEVDSTDVVIIPQHQERLSLVDSIMVPVLIGALPIALVLEMVFGVPGAIRGSFAGRPV